MKLAITGEWYQAQNYPNDRWSRSPSISSFLFLCLISTSNEEEERGFYRQNWAGNPRSANNRIKGNPMEIVPAISITYEMMDFLTKISWSRAVKALDNRATSKRNIGLHRVMTHLRWSEENKGAIRARWWIRVSNRNPILCSLSFCLSLVLPFFFFVFVFPFSFYLWSRKPKGQVA